MSVFHAPKRGYVRRKRELPPSVILHACAGWGKSVFLAQLENELSDKAAAFSLEFCEGKEELEQMLRDSAERLLGSALSERFGVEEFITLCKEHKWTVLADNIDRSDKTASRIVRRLALEASEDGYRFVGACREIPGELLSAAVDGDCLEITTAELAFTEGETSDMLKLFGKKSDPSAARSLLEYSGGYPVAQAFVLSCVRNSGQYEDWSACAELSQLSRYISANILEDLDKELCSYLKCTAFLGKCGMDTARAVLPLLLQFAKHTPREMLAMLIGNGILVNNKELSEYPEYSPAVRQALSGMLSESERSGLLSRAVSFSIENNMLAEAVSMLDGCGNSSAVENILIKRGRALLENREFELIGYCADIFDRCGAPSQAETYGILAQYYYYKGEYPRMERCYNAADSMFGKDNIYGACRKLYNGLLRYKNDPETYAENIREASSFLRENNEGFPFLHSADRELFDSVMKVGVVKQSKPLVVRRFGEFSISIAESGREIQWRTRKACEFMAYMLENNGKPVGRDKLLEVLWPFDMPNNAVAMLHNIIYNLRRELSAAGTENFIRYRDKCYSLDMSMAQDEDEDIFELCGAYESGSVSRVIEMGKNTLEYWGKYLRNVDCDWADNLREHYDKCFVEISSLLAEHYHQNGDYSSEFDILNVALSLDPYSEKIVRDIIYCYIAQGRPNKAKEKYEAFCEFIGNELGISPGKWLRDEYLSSFSNNL